ncbi:hypothetical protein N7470_006652 [Penicillium chermesinum]|nr:hypothetical protein N7470_006652 [Penicillium chermesinum]
MQSSKDDHPHKDNPLPEIHRYITTHTTEGEAVFLSHAQVPDYLPSRPSGDDGEIALLYATTATPASLEEESDVAMYDEFLHQPPGLTTETGTILRMVDLRPGKKTPMHRHVSLDYGVVLEGDVDLILDSGGEQTFQNKNSEAWCRIMFVYLPIEKLRYKERELGDEVYDEGYENSGDE